SGLYRITLAETDLLDSSGHLGRNGRVVSLDAAAQRDDVRGRSRAGKEHFPDHECGCSKHDHDDESAQGGSMLRWGRGWLVAHRVFSFSGLLSAVRMAR